MGCERGKMASCVKNNTLFNPFIEASSSAILAMSRALPLRMASIWKPIGTTNTPNAVTPKIIIGSIWLRRRWRPVLVDESNMYPKILL